MGPLDCIIYRMKQQLSRFYSVVKYMVSEEVAGQVKHRHEFTVCPSHWVDGVVLWWPPHEANAIASWEAPNTTLWKSYAVVKNMLSTTREQCDVFLQKIYVSEESEQERELSAGNLYSSFLSSLAELF